jgi:hypothetical protein
VTFGLCPSSPGRKGLHTFERTFLPRRRENKGRTKGGHPVEREGFGTVIT